MDITVTHEDGEDFGTLRVSMGRDDSATMSYDGTATISLPLYNHEARELIEALQVVADAPPLA